VHAVLSVVLITSACASDSPTREETEDWQYHRDTARIEAQEAFEKMKQSCARSGGAVIVQRTFSNRIQKTPEDPQLASCARAAPGAMY
ncbi:MAG TPA: hypothetical protein VE175_07135, partial [Woeseiaceae bacterium]|nr:hypothetical protein [Woeseiaceae bacterium]